MSTTKQHSFAGQTLNPDVYLFFCDKNNPKNWGEDSHLKNGNYFCNCIKCGENFIGYKRRVYCKICHYEKP